MKSNLQIRREEKGLCQASLAGKCARSLKKTTKNKYAGFKDWGRIIDVENGVNFDLFVEDGTASRCAEILDCTIDDLKGAANET